MRVLHLSSHYDVGGAALAAYALHGALVADGVQSRFLASRAKPDDPTVSAAFGLVGRRLHWLGAKLDAVAVRLGGAWRRADFRAGWSLLRLRRTILEHRPDVVHLHWTQDGFADVVALCALDVPLVWTTHDMWAMTGGCFHAGACQRFRQACGACPQLGGRWNHDLSRLIWRRKARALRRPRLHVVAPSTWAADQARASSLLGGFPVSVIANGVDAAAFSPRDRDAARVRLGLPPAGPLVLFVANDAFRNAFKGFAHLHQAMERLAGPGLVVVGARSDNPATPSYPTHVFGHVDDKARMADFLAAADVVAVPSTYETFGLVAAEAAACARPVVAFATSGLCDVVRHGETGYLAAPGDAADLARGIAWCLETPDRHAALSRAARARMLERFELGGTARRHLALYRDLAGE